MTDKPYQDLTAEIIRHRGILFAFILSLVKNHHLAEDLFQDTCVVISAKSDLFEPGTNFLAWARAIAMREVRGAYRNKRYRDLVLSPENAELIGELWAGKQERGEMGARRAALDSCLGRLATRAFQVFRQFYEEGRTCQEIAASLGRSVPAIHMLLKRTRERLAGCIRKEMVATG